ncbi:orexin receptor type 2-like [Haliotis rubra]|uniref:orexin receptor type 2-like n=1 Tax=Haliotis rubra TaxID=36100 RepID=UPI001EE5F4B3|nr:orexin receptor type 2-like [Haliotis rubra]
MLFLAILMIVGCIGNALVFYVYHVKMKRNTTRVYILSVAAFDLLNCVVCIPHEIADMRYNYTFGRYALCKVVRVFIVFSSFGSGFILLVVAVDRYRRVCRPFQKQMSTRTARVAVTICTVLSFFISLPAYVIFGSRTVPLDIVNINGSDCSISDEYVDSPFPRLYNGVHFSIFVPSMLFLIVIYSLIRRQVIKQRRFRSKMHCQNVPSSQKGDGDKVSNSTQSDEVPTSSSGQGPSDVSEVAMQLPNNRPAREDASNSRRQERKPEHSSKDKTWLGIDVSASCDAVSANFHTSPRRDGGERRTLFMLFLITLVFVLSYLPHLTLMVTLAVNKYIFEEIQGFGLAAFNLFIRSYFINSASNPFIYSFCSTNFRRELGVVIWKLNFRATKN